MEFQVKWRSRNRDGANALAPQWSRRPTWTLYCSVRIHHVHISRNNLQWHNHMPMWRQCMHGHGGNGDLFAEQQPSKSHIALAVNFGRQLGVVSIAWRADDTDAEPKFAHGAAWDRG